MTHDLAQPPALGYEADLDTLIVPGATALLVAPAQAASLDDWDILRTTEPTPDVGWLMGRYVHAGKPPNRNGLAFRPHELPNAIRRVVHKPLDMIHDPRRIVGTHAAQRMVYPNGDMGQPMAARRGAPPGYTDTPYAQVLAAVWSYHYPEEAELITSAYKDGKAFLSMACLPASVQCDTCEHIAPWQGYTSDAYCEHMQGLRFKWTNDPLFLGGAVIIPPINPGWSRAAITRLNGFLGHDDDITQLTYAGVAAIAGNVSEAELELLTAVIIAQAFNEDPAIAGSAARKISVLAGKNLSAPSEATLIPDDVAAAMTAAAGDPAHSAVAEIFTAAADRVSLDRYDIEQLVDADDHPASAWAEAAWRDIVAGDLDDMAPGLDGPKAAWAEDGTARSDGSFPIPNLLWLRKAELAWARVADDDQYEVKRHLLDRATQLEAPDQVVARIERLGPPIAKAAEQDGAVVVLRPPTPIAEQLAAAGTEPVDEIHVTLAFCGTTNGDEVNLDGWTATRDQVHAAVAAWAAAERPIMATLSGWGTFAQGDGEVTYASIDAPGLAELRVRLTAALGAAAIPMSTLHGFTPHATVAYHESGAGPADLPTGMSWQIEEVEVWWGGDHTPVRLG